MRRLVPLLALLVAATASAAASTKTIVIVRHAEAAVEKGGDDPELAPIGEKRAAELARVLADAKLDLVFASPLKRSQQTAEAVAQRAGAKVTVVADVPKTVAALRAVPWGQSALVVGHSNTIPDLLTGLGLPAPTAKVAFDTIWVVTMTQAGGVSAVQLHYGAP